jgi:lysozyme family protein
LPCAGRGAGSRMLSAAFERALAFTLKWEGGFSDDPRDHGGATNHGVSFRFLRDLPISEADMDRDGTLTWRDVRDMPVSAAARIYKRYFWSPLRLDQVPETLAMAVFDAAVNLGRARSAIFLQESVNRVLVGDGELLRVDGAVGPKTLAALNRACAKGGGTDVLEDVLRRRAGHYLRLGKSRQYAWALGGWMNRVRDLWAETVGTQCPF